MMDWRIRRWQLLILWGAFAARMWRLADVPPGILRDETLNNDIARFIREGQHALFFREGFGHEPLFHYLSVPFAPLLGENVLAVRLPAVFLGMLLVAAVLRWVKRDFGVAASLIAGSLVAFSWWGLIFSRVGLRPILMPLLLVGGAYFWQKRPVLAGVGLGLSIYSYTAARVIWLWPLLVLVGIGGWLVLVGRGDRFDAKARRREVGKGEQARDTDARMYGEDGFIPHLSSLIPSAIVFVVSFLMYLPMQVVLWRDPTLQQRVNQLRGPLDALAAGDLQPVWQNFWRTVGIFGFNGDPLWSYAVPERPLFGWVIAFFFYVGMGVLLWWIYKGEFKGFLLSGWFVVGLAPSVVADDAPSLVRLIGLLPLTYLMVTIGVVQAAAWLGQRIEQAEANKAMLVPLGLVVLGLTGWHAIETGRVWVAEPAVREKYQSVWLDMARYYDETAAEGVVIADSWYEPVKADSLRLDLGYRPEARWVQNQRGLVLPVNRGLFYVPEFGPPHPLLFGLIKGEPLYRSGNYPSFAVYALPSEFEGLRNESAIALSHAAGGRVQLLGYEWVVENNERHLLSYWQVDGLLPTNMSTFLHGLDGDGNLVVQYDGLDVAPETLRVGDKFVQLHTLPADVATARVLLGLYTRHDGVRFVQEDGGDAVEIEGR